MLHAYTFTPLWILSIQRRYHTMFVVVFPGMAMDSKLELAWLPSVRRPVTRPGPRQSL